ncbi:MAG: L7Ae/L30e/S12e/Gadd45 family ribosomal protein [Bacilli bacterium]|jgi:ribosomal protein L7Ae-like RNA K-turn-binding protein
MNSQVNGYLGLARRGGKLLLGENALTPKNATKIKLLIIAHDLSPRTEKTVMNYGEFHAIPLLNYLTKATLGPIIGAKNVGVMALTCRHLSSQIISLLMKEGEAYGQKEN